MMDSPQRKTIPSVPDIIDPVSTAYIKDPYPLYTTLRRERPVVPMLSGGHLLVRHTDILNVLASPDFGNSPSHYSTLHPRNRDKYPAADLAANILPFLDPPNHTAPRRMIASAFRKRFQGFSSDIGILAESQVAKARDDGVTEVISKIAEPFSLAAMCRFLGLPEDDGPMLKDFADSFFYLFAPISDPDRFKLVNDHMNQFRNYITDQLRHRRTNPGEDLISELMRVEYQGHRMNDSQVIDTCILIFADGVENVQYGIGNILIELFDKPGLFAGAAESRSQANSIVGESLRLNSPAQLISRIVLKNTVIHGIELKSDTPVFLALASANRDESVFEEAESFIVDRDRTKVLTFGSGRHACIGEPLAVLQSSTLITELARSGCKIRTGPDDASYIPRFGHRWPMAVNIDFKTHALMSRTILIIGNSHINSFRRCFSSVMKDKNLPADVEYVMTNLLKSPWGDFRKNAYVRHLQYKDNLAPDVDLRDKKIWVDLVLVGMSLLGGGIALPYGGIRAVPRDDIENARKYTAKLPLLPGIPEDNYPEHTSAEITEEDARTIYRDFYKQKFSKISKLVKMGGFKSLHWIPEPDMTESAGSCRFGNDLVQSGLYGIHRRLAREVVDDLIELFGLQENILFHPEEYYMPSGFIDDRFRASISAFDAHLHPDYYRDSCSALLQNLIRQKVNV